MKIRYLAKTNVTYRGKVLTKSSIRTSLSPTIPFHQHIVCLALREELIGECLHSNLSTAGGGLGELQDEMLFGVLSVHPLSLINLKY